MNRKRHMKKFIGALVIVCLGLCAYLITVYAAPSNTRGRVAIDLADFTEAGYSGGTGHGLDPSDYGYELHYNNHLFSDHDHDGVTYRSNKTFDMTDVDGIQVFLFARTSDTHAFLIYSTEDANKTYHERSFDDINRNMFDTENNVDGKLIYFSEVSQKVNQFSYNDAYFVKGFNVTDSYENRYVYIALCHGPAWANAKIWLGNSAYTGKWNTEGTEFTPTNGSIALMLKEHKVTLLEPKKATRIKEYKGQDINLANETEEYTAYWDFALKLNDGVSYSAGTTGSVYRDEKIVCWLYGFVKCQINRL